MKKLTVAALFIFGGVVHAAPVNVLDKLTSLKCATSNEDDVAVYELKIGPSNPGAPGMRYVVHTYQSGVISRKTDTYLVSSAAYDKSANLYTLKLEGARGSGTMTLTNGAGGIFEVVGGAGSGVLQYCEVKGNWYPDSI